MSLLRNFNTNLNYFNLSGNKRLQIRTETRRCGREPPFYAILPNRADVIWVHESLGTAGSGYHNHLHSKVYIPEEGSDRRVRSSLSTVFSMEYFIADSLGRNDHLTMLDLVHEFPGRKGEAIFAMFGRTLLL